MTPECWQALAYSRTGVPRDVKEPRERGRQTTAILVTSPAAFRRPRAVACRAEGAVTSSARLRSHPVACNAGLTHQDRWRLRSTKKRCGAPLRDGRPCSVLPRLHSLESTAPASAASFTARQADDRNQPASTGHRPCPASDAQLLRPSVGQGWGEYGAGGEGGDKLCFLTRSRRPRSACR